MPTNKHSDIAGIFAVAVLLVLSATSALGAEDPTTISLADTEGKTIRLPDLMTGKPSLLVFWATWCGPCRAEIPRITEAHRRFSDDGLAVLAINPGIRDSLTNVRRYGERFQLKYPVYFDSNQATRSAFNLIGTPTIILFDADGKEIQRGETIDLKAIERMMSLRSGKAGNEEKLETGPLNR